MTGLRTLPDIEPVAVEDKVRDVMMMTVPGLKDEEDDPIVESDVPMMDDGCEKLFAKAYIHDEIPWMDMRHEVRDLMFLVVPELDIPEGETCPADADIPDDGMEARISERIRIRGEVVRAVIAAAGLRAMISAPMRIPMIAPSAVQAGVVGIPAPSAVPMIGASGALLRIPAPVAVVEAPVDEAEDVAPVAESAEEHGPAVMFSFGSSEVSGKGWRVCFSF